MSTDPDSFIREQGADAMALVIDDSIPLQALLLRDIISRGECRDPRLLKARRLCERDLLEAAGSCLALVAEIRNGGRVQIDDAAAEAQREVIALAARGLAPLSRLDVLSDDAFTGAPRLLAWWCARRALRASGRRSTFAGARHALVTAPRLEVPLEAWAELHRETSEELDDAEAIERPSVEAIGRLLAYQRAQRARTWIAPVLEAMDRGAPAVDTGARLREAADIFEGRT